MFIKSFGWSVSVFLAVAGLAKAELAPVSKIAGLPPAQAANYVVAERGANHRVFARVTYETNKVGKVIARTNSAYTEIETSMHYFKDGEWKKSSTEIEITKDGAISQKTRHKVAFDGNINVAGAVELITPDGKHLKSHVLGLAYLDTASGKSVLIAELKDSQGQLLPAKNKVIYPDAFTDVKADVLYTLTKAGLVQDIILREQPPSPKEWGLDPATTKIQVLTEFLDPPEPVKEQVVVDGQTGLTDERRLDFGEMTLGKGPAFALGAANQKSGVPVMKQWTVLNGRQFLVESVQYNRIENSLKTLPEKPQAALPDTPKFQNVASVERKLPSLPTKKSEKPIEVAQLDIYAQPGFVLDYEALTSQTNFTFKGDSTYFCSGDVYLDGTTTIEGGTVVKFNRACGTMGGSGGTISFNGPIDCQTTAYSPAIFTAMDDDTVGETISGSWGTPWGSYGGSESCPEFRGSSSDYCLRFAQSGLDLRHLRVSFLDSAFYFADSSGVYLRDLQLLNSYVGIQAAAGLHIQNGLFANLTYVFWAYGASEEDAGNGGTAVNVSGEHLTMDGCANFAYGHSVANQVALTNSLLVGVPDLTDCTLITNQTAEVDGSAFQSVGAGNYYLADGTYRNAGTTNISPWLLTELKQKTTYPPTILTNTITTNTTLSIQALRDTNTLPALGYHYAPIDYAVNIAVSNATLTIALGTVLATFSSSGIRPWNNAHLVSEGDPLNRIHFLRYYAVQEQPINWGGETPGATQTILPVYQANPLPTASFRFTDFDGMSGCGVHVYNANSWKLGALTVQDCAANSGTFQMENSSNSVVFKNNIFERSACNFEYNLALDLRNNLWKGSSTYFLNDGSQPWHITDNVFHDCEVTDEGNPTAHHHNAYIAASNRLYPTNASDVVLTNFVYDAGTFGNYYQASTNLINRGSRSASDAGLFHYTTATNVTVEEAATVVDIGLHYIADSDGDGLSDAWELKYFGNLNQTASGDGDEDGLANLQEYQLGTNPTNWDTDGDGLSDSEELSILVDVNNPSLGYLDPFKRQTRNTGTDDGDKDSDHDGLSNWHELNWYNSNPADAHTFNTSTDDGRYLFSVRGGSLNYMARLIIFESNNQHDELGLIIENAAPGQKWDLYFTDDISVVLYDQFRWKWRRVYSGIVCDTSGDAVFFLQQPNPGGLFGAYVILDASDDDGDGLSNGYEAWFTYGVGLRTKLNARDSETPLDLLLDNWEVEYGLDPTDPAGINGGDGNPDDDDDPNDGSDLTNLKEFGRYSFSFPSYDPLKVYNTSANRPVVSIVNSTANPSCEEASFTISRYVGDGGNYDQDLAVYYAVGGTLAYNTDPSYSDYTLSTPADPNPPQGAPRIFSAVIPATETSVEVTVTADGVSATDGVEKLVVTLTPYSVSPVPQEQNANNWIYVVDWANNRAEITFDFQALRPRANNQSITVCPDADTPITLTSSDDCNDPLMFIIVSGSGPTHGTLLGTAPNLTYRPNVGYQGSDSFRFKVNDGLRDSVEATVSITVSDQLVADAQSVQACRHADTPITLTGSLPCGGSPTFSVVSGSGPIHGTLSGTPPNLSYRPFDNYEGSDEFDFIISDGTRNSQPAAVSIEVGYQPIADGQSRVTDLTRPINITLTGSDQCGDSLTYSIVTEPTLGARSGTLPNVTYTPVTAGQDTFTFKVNDEVRDSAEATVFVDVLPAPSLIAVCRPGKIKLAWSIPDWAIVKEFLIYRSETTGGTYTLIDTVAANIRSYSDTTVAPNTTYYYVVSFHYTDDNTVYESPLSNETSATTCDPPVVIRPGFTSFFIPANDDGSSGLISLPFTINFFGTSHSSLYVNNNGNVTFINPLVAYTPEELVSLHLDIIAPFWADVDTRAPLSELVWYGDGTVDGRTAFGVNWLDVGYFEAYDDKLNSFQLVIVERSDRAAGDYDVEFNYAQIQWETGDASGGNGGYGGFPARAGYASVDGSTFGINGSGISGAFLDSNTNTGLIYHSFNSTVLGRYVFQFHNGVPLATP